MAKGSSARGAGSRPLNNVVAEGSGALEARATVTRGAVLIARSLEPWLRRAALEAQASIAGIMSWLRGAALESGAPVAGGAALKAQAPVPWLRGAALEAQAPVAGLVP